jgi:hypothetical protein
MWLRWILAAAALPLAAPAPPSQCGLFEPTAQGCLSCHKAEGHVFDVDYASAAAGNPMLRPADEVVRRGVLLPDGQVRCTTCHDARSPWKDRIALPPGSKVMPGVNPFDKATFDGPPRPPPRPGDAVSPKPLCLACHALD